MENEAHIRFLGIMVFIFAIFTGLALIADGDLNLSSFFGGALLISYTLLQLAVGFKRNEDEGEDS